MSEPEILSLRLDVWLWRARFFKTRGLSARFIESGGVRTVRGAQSERITKPAHSVRLGDHLVFSIGTRLVDVTVTGLGERRGPASEAQKLYATISTSHQDQN